jgi:hypothetical protein
MLKPLPNIDNVVAEVAQHMSNVYKNYQRLNPDVHANYGKGAALIAFRLGLEYFVTTRDILANGHVISGGSLARTAFENMIDLFYIYDKPEKYPKAYVESMEAYRKLMAAAANKVSNTLAQSRELKQANKWTNATIEQRITAISGSFLTLYDMLSYFSHPNPGSLTYITNEKLQASQLNLLKQANCLTALSLMSVVLNHSDITSTKREELDNIAQKMGTQL